LAIKVTTSAYPCHYSRALAF